jgi:hypothetical protein
MDDGKGQITEPPAPLQHIFNPEAHRFFGYHIPVEHVLPDALVPPCEG